MTCASYLFHRSTIPLLFVSLILLALPAQAVTPQVKVDGYRAMVLKSDGTVWAWGINSAGILGDGSTINRPFPVQVSGLSNATAIEAGDYHSLALTADGSVWAWGFNGSGQLGNGGAASSSLPVRVSGLTTVVAIAAGGYHSAAVKSDGTVWAWGLNEYGQLGDGTRTNRSSPVLIPGLTSVVAVAAGHYFTVALKSNGTVWAWGGSPSGAGEGGIPVNSPTPVQISGLTNIVAIAAGNDHAVARSSGGTVWAWGRNGGALGNGSLVDSPVPVQVSGLVGASAIAAGGYNSAALKSDRSMWIWGSNLHWQLGNGNTTDNGSSLPVQAGLTNVLAIATGGDDSAAIKSDGTVWAWGWNNVGQLGNGNTVDSSVPVQVRGPNGQGFLSVGTATITYSIAPTSISVSEQVGSVVFTVVRSDSTAAQTLYASTVQTHGSTNAGDYVGKVDEPVAFSVGQTEQHVTVQINNDLAAGEGNETFGLIVQSAIGPAETFVASARFTIQDNDDGTPPGVVLTPEDTSPPVVVPPRASPSSGSERNLVLLVHGWNSNPDAWAKPLGEQIRARIDDTRSDATQWDVYYLDWSRAADALGISLDPTNGPSEVAAIAPVVAARAYPTFAGKYRHVHLIGHSAGSNLIEQLAYMFKNRTAGGAPVVHQTFLDAYNSNGNKTDYGCRADWAESYVDMDGSFIIKNTNLTLPGAVNIDITELDKNAYSGLIKDDDVHAWPYRWYAHTAGVPPSNQPPSAGRTASLEPENVWPYGFALAREYAGTAPDHRSLPVPPKSIHTALPFHRDPDFRKGVRYCLIGPVDTFDCDVIDAMRSWAKPDPLDGTGDACSLKVRTASGVDLFSILSGTIISPSGSVTYDTATGKIVLQNGSPAWINLTGNLSNEIDTLVFDYSFTSGAGSDGMLSVYMDGRLVSLTQQQFAETGVNSSGPIPLGPVAVGTHSLAFRLDMLTEVPSRVEITNVRFGISEVERTNNIPPIAKIASVSTSIMSGSRVVLDGRPSSDPDSLPSPLSFLWAQVAGPQISLDTMRSNLTTVTPEQPGDYRFRLVVRDGQDESLPAEVSFTVSSTPVSGGGGGGGGGGALSPWVLLMLGTLAQRGYRRRRPQIMFAGSNRSQRRVE